VSSLADLGQHEPKVVRPSDWLSIGLGGDGKADVKELHPLQRVGFMLALCVFGYIVIATVFILYISFYSTHLPSLPEPPTMAGDIDHYRQLVEAYRQSVEVYQSLAKMQVERAIQLFQLIVASTILPAFTAILGYIFGSRKNETS
jgi:hypothetical protein